MKAFSFLDLIPILIQAVNDVTRPSGFWTWDTLLYALATFLLYSIQVALTVTAVVVLYFKSSKYAKNVLVSRVSCGVVNDKVLLSTDK